MNPNNKTQKTVLIFVVLVAALVAAWLWYARSKPRVQEDNLLQSVTAPAGVAPQVPQKTIETVTSPKTGKPVSEDVMRSLTAPAAK
ncbi:hypothetical protein KGQ34_03365 [Patescibacteria group bacterium]|nr:hypothetical protein [Patescibacteria group bacterium]